MNPSSLTERACQMISLVTGYPPKAPQDSPLIAAFVDALARVRAEALEEAAVEAEHTSDCDLRCMNDCKLNIADAIRALKGSH